MAFDVNLKLLRLVETTLDELRLDIIASQQQKNLKASGRSAELLRTEEIQNGGQIVDGSGYFPFQEYGRGPSGSGGTTQGETLRDKIYTWLALKKYGLAYSTDSQRKSLAFLIARKIHAKGTYIFITGNNTGVITETLTGPRILEFKQEVMREATLEILSDVRNAFAA